MKTYFGHLICVLLACLGPPCHAQAVTIHVINGENGQSLQQKKVFVTLLYDDGRKPPAKYDANLAFETDKNGEARFSLPIPLPAHLAAQVHVDSGRWRCGCGALVATEDLLQKGIVGPVPPTESRKPAIPVKAVPGEILFVARPLSFFERLLYPFVKG
jgi:hypothetical protein